MKTLLFANTDWYLFNFRIPLLIALKARGDEVVLVSPPGEYSERLQKRGFHWLAFPFSRSGVNLLLEMGTIWRLYHLYRQESPDVFIHFTIKCVLYGSIVARLLGKKTVINSIDGLGYVFSGSELKARLLRFFVKPLYRLALRNTFVIFQNPDDRDAFLEMGMVKEGNYALIRGVGIEVSQFRQVEQVEHNPVVLYAGRLLRSKGVEILIEAIRILQSKGVLARFALAGKADPGNPESIQEGAIHGWVVDGLIEHWGWHDDMPAVYQRAHIFCLPTIYREGLPSSLMEAAASALPIVASDVPGCREIVFHGENGWLVPPNDAGALAGALQHLIRDANLRTQMGMRGREIVAECFSADQIVSEIIAQIERYHQQRQGSRRK